MTQISQHCQETLPVHSALFSQLPAASAISNWRCETVFLTSPYRYEAKRYRLSRKEGDCLLPSAPYLPRLALELALSESRHSKTIRKTTAGIFFLIRFPSSADIWKQDIFRIPVIKIFSCHRQEIHLGISAVILLVIIEFSGQFPDTLITH